MYQGVVKDEIRVRERAAAKSLAAAGQTDGQSEKEAEGLSMPSGGGARMVVPSTTSIPPLNTPGASVQRPVVSPDSHRPLASSSNQHFATAPDPSAQASGSGSSSRSPSSGRYTPDRHFDEDASIYSSSSSTSFRPAPIGGVGVPQPAPVYDDDCLTCIISPPPELVEAQSKEDRQREREERLAEYEAQKALGGRLEQEQGVHADPVGGRLV